MNLTAILDRLDDQLNPIVVKELRQAVKSRMVVGILGLFLGLQLLLLGFYLLSGEMRSQSQVIDWSAGYEVFRIQQGILLFTIMIAVPAYACIRLANERTDQNVDLMFISTLRPASIVWGKFFAAVVLGLLVFSACAPFTQATSRAYTTPGSTSASSSKMPSAASAAVGTVCPRACRWSTRAAYTGWSARPPTIEQEK